MPGDESLTPAGRRAAGEAEARGFRTRSTTTGDTAEGIARLLETATQVAPGSVAALVDVVCSIVGAGSGRLLVADYGLLRLQHLDLDGSVGDSQPIEGTVAGRAFTSGEIVGSTEGPGSCWVPLTDGTERLGVLELALSDGDAVDPDMVRSVTAALVLLLIARKRYSDLWSRARRTDVMSASAEAQWALLPPLSCTTSRVAIGGIVEPAYDIGGDSFDYAINGDLLEFAIVDAIGRGMSAVLMAGATINSLRNDRRSGRDVTAGYRHADRVIAEHFGDTYYVTGQIGSLDLTSGRLTWLNAGHVPPMLVRNGTFGGELHCRPSMPMGLGGPAESVATEDLQRGDRVLFYTDGITESEGPDGKYFGTDRLADFLVRASLEHVPAAETVRRLGAAVVTHVGAGLRDDATMLLIEYLGNPDPPPDTGTPGSTAARPPTATAIGQSPV